MSRPSMCASGIAGTFYWRECAAGDHVAAAADAILAALAERPRREWGSPYVKADTRAAVRSRLRAAERGRLRGGEWRPIRLDPDLYELRWTDLRIAERDPVTGRLDAVTVHARLYYAENAPERWFLGLHVHEKRLDGSDAQVQAWQDDAIRAAATAFRDAAHRRWGVPELGGAARNDVV